MFFEKQYYEEALLEEDKQDTKNYNWCERNLMFKDPANSRILYLWDLIFFISFTVESYMVPYVVCTTAYRRDYLVEKVYDFELVIDVLWCV